MKISRFVIEFIKTIGYIVSGFILFGILVIMVITIARGLEYLLW